MSSRAMKRSAPATRRRQRSPEAQRVLEFSRRVMSALSAAVTAADLGLSPASFLLAAQNILTVEITHMKHPAGSAEPKSEKAVGP